MKHLFDDFCYMYDLIEALESLQDKGMDRFRIEGLQKHGDGTTTTPDGSFYLDLTIGDLQRCMEKTFEYICYVKASRKLNNDEDI
jgi:hypothetical protein